MKKQDQPHIWSYPDDSGVKHCLYDGCDVRVRRAYAEWQARKGAPWTSIITSDIPQCTGTPPA
jgi:hypothetical protein